MLTLLLYKKGAKKCPLDFGYTHRFLRAIAECFTRLSHGLGFSPSVRPSVCLSVTLVSCIKTVQTKIMKSLP